MKFNGPEFSARMTQILLSGDYKKFETILENTIYPPEESNRISKLLSLRRDVEDSINKNYPNTKKIHLSEFENKSTYLESVSVKNLLTCEDGLYSEMKNQIHMSTFDIDMKHLSPQTIKRLRDCGFDAKIHYEWNYKYRVLSDVQFCTEHYNLYACISNGRFYDRAISARLAKSCYINFVRDHNEIIDEAIILPVPHHIKNYYHVMSEMVYALRNCINNDIPIIYPDDHFKIIPFISKKLGINIDRFISFPEARSILIKKSRYSIPTFIYLG